jgi:hypothetical protein
LDFLEHRQEDWPNVGEHVPNVNTIAFNRETWSRHREELRLYHMGLGRTMVVPSNDRNLFLLNGAFRVDNDDVVAWIPPPAVRGATLLDGRPATCRRADTFGNDDQSRSCISTGPVPLLGDNTATYGWTHWASNCLRRPW